MFILHHNDWDGKASAAIVYQRFKDAMPIKFQQINYNEAIKFQEINNDELVYIVDFSLTTQEQWDKLFNITTNIIWIDHHKTVLEKWPLIHKELKGVRDITKSGCLLTWEYLNDSKPIPDVIKYLNDFDLWKFEFKEDTKNLQLGMSLKARIYKPDSDLWRELFNHNTVRLKALIDKGSIITQYKTSENAALMKQSYYITFEGYKCICVNGHGNSMLFDSIDPNTYDIMIRYNYTNKKNWVVSLYTKKDDVDVSEIAKRYGGGGHRQAAGFTISNMISVLLDNQ